MSQEKGENFFIELLKVAVPVVVIVLVVRLWIAQPFIVSGASMSPTFQTGQYLLVDELTYHFNAPERGDVIIFKYPKDPSQYFIKRIIGLPGETVTITDSSVSVTESDGTRETLSEPYITNRGNGTSQTVTLGPEQYFVMGDNRPDSSDSRYWGDLPRQNIVGRAFLRLLPVTELGVFPGKANIQASISAEPLSAGPRTASPLAILTAATMQFSGAINQKMFQ